MGMESDLKGSSSLAFCLTIIEVHKNRKPWEVLQIIEKEFLITGRLFL